MPNIVVIPGLIVLAILLLVLLASMPYGACADMGLVPGDPRCS